MESPQENDQALVYASDTRTRAESEEEIRLAEERRKLEGQVKSGANWFYWIAALSLINSILFLTESEWSFLIGLGITQIIDALATTYQFDMGDWVKYAAFVLDVIIAGIFASFGLLASRRHAWAFIVGGILYILDGLIFLALPLWFELPPELLNIGFHLFALFFMFTGLRANMKLSKLEQEHAQELVPSGSKF